MFRGRLLHTSCIISVLMILLPLVIITTKTIINVGVSSKELIHSETYTDNGYKYTLGLLVIAKNESMIIEEFIEHYLWQGVEQFYIIDNGSTDNFKEKVDPYIKDDKVQYFDLPQPHNQEGHYNDIYNRVAKHECKWLIVCDVDEYMYNKTKGHTLKDYVNSIDHANVGVIYLNWKMFGSNGYEKQPRSIRKSFLHRHKDVHQLGKCIINTTYVTRLHTHHHDMSDDTKHSLRPVELALNHYPLMSKEYFAEVKMTRGDVAVSDWNVLRNWVYFENYDRDTNYYDDELANLVD